MVFMDMGRDIIIYTVHVGMDGWIGDPHDTCANLAKESDGSDYSKLGLGTAVPLALPCVPRTAVRTMGSSFTLLSGGASIVNEPLRVLLPHDRSCPQREILTFGCTELILTHDKLLSMPQVTPILTNMYIIHNNTHMGP